MRSTDKIILFIAYAIQGMPFLLVGYYVFFKIFCVALSTIMLYMNYNSDLDSMKWVLLFEIYIDKSKIK